MHQREEGRGRGGGVSHDALLAVRCIITVSMSRMSREYFMHHAWRSYSTLQRPTGTKRVGRAGAFTAHAMKLTVFILSVWVNLARLLSLPLSLNPTNARNVRSGARVDAGDNLRAMLRTRFEGPGQFWSCRVHAWASATIYAFVRV